MTIWICHKVAERQVGENPLHLTVTRNRILAANGADVLLAGIRFDSLLKLPEIRNFEIVPSNLISKLFSLVFHFTAQKFCALDLPQTKHD